MYRFAGADLTGGAPQQHVDTAALHIDSGDVAMLSVREGRSWLALLATCVLVAMAPQACGSDLISFIRAYDLWVIDPDTLEERQLTADGTTYNLAPRWSPDGSRIAYSSWRDGDSDIYVVGADGTGNRRLTDSAAADAHPTWSPDGTTIAYHSSPTLNGGEYDIYTMDSDGSNRTPLATSRANEWGPEWSPNGSDIAYWSKTDNGPEQIYSATPDGLSTVAVSNRASLDFAWSPDGKKIVFGTDTTGNETWLVRADGTGLTRIHRGLGARSYAWSPDGTKIAVQAGGDLYTFHSDGTALTQLPTGGGNHPSWSPDGSRIAFHSPRTGVHGLYIVGAGGGGETRLANSHNADRSAWRPLRTMPFASADRLAIEHGVVTVGVSDDNTLSISNTGVGVLDVTGIASTDVQFVAAPTAFTLAEGESQPVTVSFTPNAVGAASARLLLVHNGLGTGEIEVTGIGTAAPPSAQIDVSAALLEFQTVLLGSTRTLSFTVANDGDAPLSADIASDDAQFEVSPAHVDVPTGSGANVTVMFAPALVGWEVGTLNVTHNAPGDPIQMMVEGIGRIEPPVGDLTDTRIAFRSSRDGNEQVYTVNTGGTDPLNLSRGSSSDGAPAWSSDGSALAFASDRDAGLWGLYVMSADGENASLIVSGGRQHHLARPAWSPNGALLAFVNAQSQVHIVAMDGSLIGAFVDREVYGSSTDPAWSPDGSKVAFRSNLNGTGAIYVMHADGSDLYQLTYPEEGHDSGDQDPAWSPDGTRIGYSSDRGVPGNTNFEIVVVDVDGRNEVRLTSSPGQDVWPSWSPDGSMLAFSSNRDGLQPVFTPQSLFTMNADGSSVRQLMAVEEYQDTQPSWSPFLSSAIDVQPPATAIASPPNGHTTSDEQVVLSGASTDNQSVTTVTINGEPLAIAAGPSVPWTYVVTLHEGANTFAVVASDAAGNTASETLVVTYAPATPTIDVSETTLSLGTTSLGSGLSLSFTITNDGDAPLSANVASNNAQFVVSPVQADVPAGSSRSMTVTFAPAFVGWETATLTVTHNAPGDPIQVTAEGIGTIDPPAGDLVEDTEIAFSIDDDIRIIRPDGSDARHLTDDRGASFDGINEGNPSWSPDGSRLAYTAAGQLYTRGSDGADPVRVSDTSIALGAYDTNPAWSPLGDWIAFETDQDRQGEVHAVRPDGTAERVLVQSPQVDVEPSWSPDGTKVVFRSDRTGENEIWVAYADGSSPTRLTTPGSQEKEPAWSPDGAQIAFASDRAGTYDIYVMGADGSNARRVTDDVGADDEPTWSPDGSLIAFTRNGRDIYTADAQGLSEQWLVNGRYPDWSGFNRPRSDTAPPSVVIDSPSDGYVSETADLRVSGSAYDNTVIQSIAVNGQPATSTPGGDTSWSVDIALSEGTNEVVVTATDSAGNQTRESVTVTYTPPAHSFPTLTPGRPLANQSIGPGQVIRYQVAAQPGQHVYLFLEKDAPFFSYLNFSEGESASLGSRGALNQARQIQTTVEGFVVARLQSDTDTTGTFTITAREQLVFPALNIGESLPNQTIRPGEILWYQVAVQAGQRLYLSLDKDSPFGSYLGVAEGRLASKGSRSSDSVYTEFQTTGEGFATVRLQSDSGANETFTITVAATASAPSFSAISAQAASIGTTLTFSVGATASDDGPLVYEATSLPLGAAFDPTTRRFEWTPTIDQAGSHTATFRVTNGLGEDTLTVTISVADTNQPPVFSGIGGQSAAQGDTLTFLVSATDQDGGSLTYEATTLPSGATFDPTSRRFTWTPTFEQTGSHTATFRVSDGLAEDTLSVTIAVGDVNRPPVFADVLERSTTEGHEVTFIVVASDQDDDTLTYEVIALPTGATFDLAARRFTWTPTFEQTGSHTATFRVSDGNAQDTLTVSISVGDVNRPPSFADVSNQSTPEGEKLTFLVSATDPDANALVYEAVSLPSGADFNADARRFTWTPDFTQAGTYTATFRVSDGQTEDTLSVAITVENVNLPPSFVDIPAQTVAEGEELTFLASATDPDADDLVYEATSMPSGARLNTSNGRFRWTPDFTQSGEHAVVFRVTDGSVSRSQTVNVIVEGTDVLSIVGPSDISGDENEALAAAAELAPSAEGEVSLNVQGLPVGADFDVETGTFTFVPDYTQSGTYDVVISASDAGQEVDHETLSITVHDASPLIAIAQPSRTLREGDTLAAPAGLVANARDGVSLTVDGLPRNARLVEERGVIEFTPGFSQAGEYTVVLTATQNDEVVGGVEIHLVVDDVPVFDIEMLSGASVGEGGQVAAQVILIEQALSLTLQAESLPEHAVFDAEGAVFTFTPDYTQSGPHTLTVIALEDDQEVDRRSVEIVVEDALPIVVTPSVVPPVAEGGRLVVRVTAAQAGPDIRVDGLPDSGTYDAATGRVVFRPDYTQAGTYELSLTATQNGEVVETRVLSIDVADTPVLVLESVDLVTMSEGETLSIAASIIEAAQSGIAIEVEATSLAASYSADLGEIRLAPGFGHAGNHAIAVVATDGEQIVERAEILVTVVNVPALFVTPSESLAVAEGDLVEATVALVPEAIGRATLALVAGPDNAAFDSGSGLFTFAPNYAQQGVHEATLGVSENGEIVDSVTARIVVQNVDVLSTASEPVREVPEGGVLAMTFDVLDAASGAITLAAPDLPTNTSFDATTGTVTFRPGYSQSGVHQITVVAQQRSAVVETERIVVNVTHVNLAPEITLADVGEEIAGAVTIGYSVADFDGDPVSLVAEYHFDGDWLPATLHTPVQNTVRYQGSMTWMSRADIPSTSGSEVEIRVTPSDDDTGVPAITSTFRLVNLLGDYNDDFEVGFDDLELFTTAWRAQDAFRDIGPSTGNPPDLQPDLDGVLDFEDLTTFVRMWNWSADAAPLAVPSMMDASTSSDGLAYEMQEGVGDWSTRRVHISAPFDLDTQAARLTIAYDPESVAVRVSDDSDSRAVRLTRTGVDASVIEVQIAWLDMPNDDAPMLSLDLTTLGPGDTDLRITFDIRDAEGMSHRGMDVIPLRFESLPTITRLLANYPNPFNPETWIPFELSQDARVIVSIYDLEGGLIRALHLGGKTVGRYRGRARAAHWDGTNEQGEAVASGIYVYALRAGDYREMRRLVIRK